MKLFGVYLREKLPSAAFCAALCGVLLLSGWLCGLERKDILYCLLLWAALCAGALAFGFYRFARRHRALAGAAKRLFAVPDALPAPAGRLEEDYQELLRMALAERAALLTETDRRYRELRDTFTLWAHQIKNPIAAMTLLLQQEQAPDRGEMEGELLEIGRYVEMILNALRLGSESSDFVLRPCRLDDVIRPAVKKYARQFIRRRVRLEYEGTELCAVTDEKWLGFVLEQLLSNALKYTPRGEIAISVRDRTLSIRDSGIGIAPEDLPRVFEKGYTGYNGRGEKSSTGLGLWLCREVLRGLGHEIAITSEPGRGTEVTIRFPEDAPGALE